MKNLIPSPGYFSVSTSDLDHAEQVYFRSIAGAKILQVSDKEKFKLKLDYLGFNSVSLISNSITSACSMEALLDKDDFRLVLALHAPSQFSWRGHSYLVSEKQGIVVNPSSKINVDRYSRSQTLVLKTSYSILKGHLELLTNQNIKGTLKFDKQIDLGQGPGAYLYELMSRLSYDAQYNDRLLQEPGIKRGYGELILGAILALPHNYSHSLHPKGKPVYIPRIVTRAEDYMRSHFNELITISDLIRICRCSQKELFSSFKSSREYTPMEFLLEQRLQAARKELIEPGTAAYTISEVAHICGFAHLGRFAKQYRKRFGELPSDSVKRAVRSIY